MDIRTLKSMGLPDGSVKRWSCAGETLWEKVTELINWALHSINPDGSIYNNGQGYKDNCRVRSGGAEVAASECVCTGFIPIKKGKTLEISPAFTGGNTDNAINFADANFTNLGQIVDAGTAYGICTSAYKSTVVDGKSVLALDDRHSADIAYVRITHNRFATAYGTNMVITVK